jgi:1,4-dihydroxy-2-naphthoate octaprenyltransferase
MTEEENIQSGYPGDSLPHEDSQYARDAADAITEEEEPADRYLDPISAHQTVRHRAVDRTRTAARPYTAAPILADGDSGEDMAQDRSRPSVHDRAERRQTSRVRRRKAAEPAAHDRQPSNAAENHSPSSYSGHLTPKLIIELAAPHTWPASVMPVLFAVCLCIADTSAITISTALLLLAICVLMQSAVNTINDYFDYVKGADTVENQDDPTDAVLVYNDIKPSSARNLALIFLGAAFLLGIPVIIRAGWIPLVIALIGALVLFLYSGGRTPISYLPIGEIVSGFTMGGLIPLACYQVLTLEFSWEVLLYSIPLIIGVALIMFTNNTCDIEKDIEAQRKTLPVLLGRPSAVTLYRSLLVIWMAAIGIIVIFQYPTGWYGLPFMIAVYGPMKGLFHNPFDSQSRGGGMAQITATNVILGMTYSLCLLLSAAAYAVF